jgi:hypothetical protein
VLFLTTADNIEGAVWDTVSLGKGNCTISVPMEQFDRSLYHRTKDLYYVKDFLGYKCLGNTEIYINIERTLFEDQSAEFTVKVAEKQDDIKALLEAGFEYVCQKDNLVYLRKRK